MIKVCVNYVLQRKKRKKKFHQEEQIRLTIRNKGFLMPLRVQLENYDAKTKVTGISFLKFDLKAKTKYLKEIIQRE